IKALQAGVCDKTPFPLSHCYASLSTLLWRRREISPVGRNRPFFPYPEAQRNDFRAIFTTKCQFRLDKGKHNSSNGASSHVPSCTAIKVKGQWRYLYRAVDKHGQTIDFLLTEHRDKEAALRFLKKAIRRNGLPETITIDGSDANEAAIKSYN